MAYERFWSLWGLQNFPTVTVTELWIVLEDIDFQVMAVTELWIVLEDIDFQVMPKGLYKQYNGKWGVASDINLNSEKGLLDLWDSLN